MDKNNKDDNNQKEAQDDKEDNQKDNQKEAQDDKEDNKNNNDKDDHDGQEADTVPILEYHACEPDPQVAIDYVKKFGHPEQGNMECFADPVNACPGGCCRYANWFLCDTDDHAPHMSCVCNQNTAIVEPPVLPGPLGNVTLPEGGNFTQTENTMTEEDEFGEDIFVDEDVELDSEAVERSGGGENPDILY